MLVQIALKIFVYPLNCGLKDSKPYIYIYICEQIISISLKVAGIYKGEHCLSGSFKIS